MITGIPGTVDKTEIKKYDSALKAGLFDPNTVYEVPMVDIYADDAFNVRGPIQPLSVLELAREIKQQGLIQPITIQPFNLIPGKKFRIVAGHRRYKAHEVLGWEHIRATVKVGLDDLTARLINLSENTQREALTIMQEANAVSYFKLAGWTQDQVGERLGKSRGWAQTRFYLLDLPKECQEAAEAGLLSQTDIHQLWRLSDYGYDAQMTAMAEMKDRKGRGKKKQVKAEEIVKKDKKLRTQQEIFDMQEKIQEATYTTHLAAKALAWAAGVIDTGELETAIEEESAPAK